MSFRQTRVLVLEPTRVRSLREALERAGHEFRPLAHAHFQARGGGVVASLYRSGKLVLQGTGIEAWIARFLGADPPSPAPSRDRPSSAAALPPDGLGSDEAGKGDTFGPLAVCALALPPEGVAELREAGVMDSKRLSDPRIRLLATWLRSRFEYEERVLPPEEYNRRHAAAGGNLNRLLAQLHAEVLSPLLERHPKSRVVVDRFGSNCPVSKILRASDPGLVIHELPRGEAHPAVAGASILARDRFLEGLKALSEELAVDLPLGSGAPTAPALRRLLAIHGPAGLPRAAKTHFRNVRRALAEHRP